MRSSDTTIPDYRGKIKYMWKPKHIKAIGNKSLQSYGLRNSITQIYEEVRKMEIKVDEIVKLDDGLHTGKIVRIEYKEPPEHQYNYTDIFILEDKIKVEVRVGVPTKISEMTSLGEILENFGAKLQANSKLDPEKILVGKLCQFVITNEKGERGTFAKVVPTSLRPAK